MIIFSLENAEKFYNLLQEYLDIESEYRGYNLPLSYLNQQKTNMIYAIHALNTNGNELWIHGKLGYDTRLKTGTRFLKTNNIDEIFNHGNVVPNVWVDARVSLTDEQYELLKLINDKILEFLDGDNDE